MKRLTDRGERIDSAFLDSHHAVRSEIGFDLAPRVDSTVPAPVDESDSQARDSILESLEHTAGPSESVPTEAVG